ncbi:MAG: hypothetical protein FD157_674 [Rhodocyclaceae bacterium]|nr:MAG: hypothetical protein FD157_674 [Rhodocyclaceae bacterium]TND03168.1 MAG: hypothetical protein FD118_1744 [Rhodocyclaceae bacterium]
MKDALMKSPPRTAEEDVPARIRSKRIGMAFRQMRIERDGVTHGSTRPENIRLLPGETTAARNLKVIQRFLELKKTPKYHASNYGIFSQLAKEFGGLTRQYIAERLVYPYLEQHALTKKK